MGIIRDITIDKQVETSKTDFIALAAHQLRTPLTALKWYSEALLEGYAGVMSEKQIEYIHQLHASNERMVALIDSLLCVSRLDLGELKVSLEPVNIITLVHDLLAEFTHIIKEKDLKISETYDGVPHTLVLDAKLVSMVIQNIVANAILYTPPGGLVDIRLTTHEKEGIFFQCCVSDTGIGIPKMQQSKIFEKLFRADNASAMNNEGTGLGLYIVKTVLKLLGGKIDFVSELNKGSTFTVTIPCSLP